MVNGEWVKIVVIFDDKLRIGGFFDFVDDIEVLMLLMIDKWLVDENKLSDMILNYFIVFYKMIVDY